MSESTNGPFFTDSVFLHTWWPVKDAFSMHGPQPEWLCLCCFPRLDNLRFDLTTFRSQAYCLLAVDIRTRCATWWVYCELFCYGICFSSRGKAIKFYFAYRYCFASHSVLTECIFIEFFLQDLELLPRRAALSSELKRHIECVGVFFQIAVCCVTPFITEIHRSRWVFR